MSSADEKLIALRDQLYKDYEFWLGCYHADNENWKSGVVHAYRNVLYEIDRHNETTLRSMAKCTCNICICPCHICRAMRDRKENKKDEV